MEVIYPLLLILFKQQLSACLHNIYMKKIREEKEQALVNLNYDLETALSNLSKTRDQLIMSEKLASLGRFASGLAHEIKNPLNFINNFASLNIDSLKELLESVNPESSGLEKQLFSSIKIIVGEIEENSREICKHGERANAIIQRLMNITSATAEKNQTTRIDELLRDAIEKARHKYKAAGRLDIMRIDMQIVDDIPPIKCSESQLCIVSDNLIDNSFYALWKRKERDKNHDPLLTVRITRDGEILTVTIGDNGTGISPEHLDKIYEPFFTTKSPIEGSGMGLHLCYEIIVNAFGGKMQCRSREGEGSNFTILLNI